MSLSSKKMWEKGQRGKAVVKSVIKNLNCVENQSG